jgi:type I restriction enzyme M protein
MILFCTDFDNLPDPNLLAGEIFENLEAGLASFQEILGVLNWRIV